MFQYVVQTIAFQLFFLLVYDFLLKKETFFNWNRAYLLGTTLLSLVIPLIKIEHFKNVVSSEYIVTLPTVFLGNNSQLQEVNPIVLDSVVLTQQTFWTWKTVFFIGAFIAALLFGFKLIKIVVMLVKSPKYKLNNFHIVKLLNSNAAFSFFRYIFLGDQLNTTDKKAILKHEVIHVKQYHSIDLIVFEILRILFWFNPLIYMYQNRMVLLHEFIADAEAIKDENKLAYYQNLLAQVFDTKTVSFINPFFKQSLIKKRIVMLTKSRSKQINLLKYALLIPLVVGMLIYSSTEAQENLLDSKGDLQELTDKELQKKFHKELLEMKEKGFSIFEISEAFKPKADMYIISREAYYRNRVYNEYMLSLGEKRVKGLTKELNASYKDYLKYKRTEEAKLLWESDIKDGVLRLVVADLDDLTKNEEKRKSEKIALIKKDDYLHTLRIETVEGGKLYVQMYSNMFSANKRDDSKAILINNPDVHVGFDVVDKVPTFPDCEGMSNIQLKKCLTELVSNHVAVNFNTTIADKLGLIGKQRIHVTFKINDKGHTVDVSVKAAHPGLVSEATRVMNMLPKMIPGKHKGQNVTVVYALPIIFDIDSKAKQKASVITPLNDIDVPFYVIEQVPVYPGCEDLTHDEQRSCLSQNISKHVNRNFNTSLADSLGLKGRQRINVIFKIDKQGYVTSIRSKAPHPALEAEAIRVINTLPKMIPGKQNGKVVNVPYSLPIVFQVVGKDMPAQIY